MSGTLLGSSTNSLFDLAAKIDENTTTNVTIDSNTEHEKQILQKIQEQTHKDHKQKKELRKKLKAAENKLKDLESRPETQKPNTVSTPTSPTPKKNEISFEPKPGRVYTMHKDNQFQNSISDVTPSETISSGSPSRTSHRPVIVINSPNHSIPTPVFKTNSDLTFSTRNSKSSVRSKIIKPFQSSSELSDTSELSTLSSRTNSTVNSSISQPTSSTIPSQPSTSVYSRSTQISSTKFTDSDISTKISEVTPSTVYSSSEGSSAQSESEIKRFSEMFSSDSESFSESSSDSDNTIDSGFIQDYIKIMGKKKVRPSEISGTKKVSRINKYLPKKDDHYRFNYNYYHDHEQEPIPYYEQYLNMQQPQRPSHPFSHSEILADLDRFATQKFSEMDRSLKHLKHINRRSRKDIERENEHLKNNLKRIKAVVREWKRSHERELFEERICGISEKDLLTHIAREFHGLLGDEEKISRETAMLLVDRASRKMKQKSCY